MWSVWRKGRGESSSKRTSNTISIKRVEPLNYDDDGADDDDDHDNNDDDDDEYDDVYYKHFFFVDS